MTGPVIIDPPEGPTYAELFRLAQELAAALKKMKWCFGDDETAQSLMPEEMIDEARRATAAALAHTKTVIGVIYEPDEPTSEQQMQMVIEYLRMRGDEK